MAGGIQHGKGAAHRPGLGLGRPIHQFLDPGVDQGTNTHQAGLDGDIQAAVEQAIIAQCVGRLAYSANFGVAARVIQGDRGVIALTNDLIILDHDGADGDLALLFGERGQFQCALHPEFIQGLLFVTHAD